MEIMEMRAGNSYSNNKQSSENSKSATEEKKPSAKEANTSVFVNYAAIAWHDSRRKWVGNQRLQRMAKDPIISWSTAYEDLLSSNECFPEPIPLPVLRMKKFKSMLKPKPNPTEQLKDWQRRLRQESRNIERQIRDLEREEKVVQKAIREAAKRNDMGSAKSLAREILGSRKAVSRLQENKAQLNSISMHLGESVALARTVGHLSKSTEVMKLVNDLTKAPEMAVTMQQFTKEITKAGLIEEFVNDALDTTLDSEDIEEETEEEVEKVLSEIAGETSAQLPEAVRKKTKLPAHVASASQEGEAIAEGSDDEEELEALRARLAQVRS